MNTYFMKKSIQKKTCLKASEVLMKWIAEREIDDYTKFKIEIHFFIERMMKINDKYRGELRITYFAQVELDYKNNWQKSPFTKFLFFIYNNYIMKTKILVNYEPKLKRDVESVREILKEHLE